MSDNFQPGHLCPVRFKPDGGNDATLNVKSHNLDLTALLHDVTGTRHAGVRARIGGPADAQGTVQADFDLDEAPYHDPPSIRPTVRGLMFFHISPTKAIQVPVIVERLHFESAVESQVKYSFDVKMNALAGALVYPN